MTDSVAASTIITRVRRVADQESATTRFPDSELLDYVSEGSKDFWDILIQENPYPWIGLAYLLFDTVTQTGSDPAITFSGSPVGDFNILIQITTAGTLAGGLARFKWSINGGSTYTTGATVAASVTLGNTGVVATFASGSYTLNNVYSCNTTPMVTNTNQRWYDLPSDFYIAHTISAETVGGRTYLLEYLPSRNEPLMRDLSINPNGAPLYYQIQGSRAGACQIGLWPQPTNNVKIRINYIKQPPVISSTAITVDAVNGWYDYVVYFAAAKCAMKDEDWDLYRACRDEMKRIGDRIKSVAKSRSATEVPHIQDILSARRNRVMRYWFLS